MTSERPTMLSVLCILSWVWMAIMAYNLVFELASGPLSDEDIREQKIAILETVQEQDQEMIETSKWVVSESVGMLEVTQANYGILNIINVAQLLIGLAGVLMMFRLKKLGFHLYIIYSLISIVYFTYFFGQFTMGGTLAVTSGVFGGLFVLFYGMQLKHMD